jgi:hypothetical protein
MQTQPLFFKRNTVADPATGGSMIMIDCNVDKACVKFPSHIAGAAARIPQPTALP